MIESIRFARFATSIGDCALAWSADGVVGLWLPEATTEKLRARVLRRHPGASDEPPPPAIQAAIEPVQALLRGEVADLSGIALDMARVGEFEQSVYAIARAIPPGQTLTYGDIATRLGNKLLSRDVGQALGKNPFPIVVPCHRVTAANGKLGGFSAPGGTETKLRMLAIEGAPAAAQTDLFS